MGGDDLRGAWLQSAVSTPASSSATVVATGIKEELLAAPAGGEGAGAVVSSPCRARFGAGLVRVDPDSDGGKSSRTSALKDDAGTAPVPALVCGLPPRAAALAASATVAQMAKAESHAADDGASHGAAPSAAWLHLSTLAADVCSEWCIYFCSVACTSCSPHGLASG